MDYFVIAVAVLVAVMTIRDAWLVGSDDPTWDLRWRALDTGDRARLAVAGPSRSTTAAIVDPEERELAEGFGRRERQRRAYIDLVLLAALAFAAALMLAGTASLSTLGLIVAWYLMLRLGVDRLRDQQIKRRVRVKAESGVIPAP